MVFKNEAQLKNFLLNKCKDALIMAQENVYRIIDSFVEEFYADYSPEMYERTYQLYRSLVKSDIIFTGNGYKAYVYFDLSSINYITGAKPSGRQVADAASLGYHGASGLHYVDGNSGIDIWQTPKQILDGKAIEILKKMLISAGIPIK